MKLKVLVSGSILKLGVFCYIFSILGKNEWLSWLPNKSSHIDPNILETLKDSPNTPPNLKFLEQRVLELAGVL